MAKQRPRLKSALCWAAVLAVGKQIAANNLALIAAGVAFYSMLSVFPALAALIAILSLVANPTVVVVQLQEVRGLMPDVVYNILYNKIIGLVSASTETLGWAGLISLAVALWSARAGVGAMMHGLNVVYDREGRTSLRHYFRALVLTVCLLGVGVISLLTIVVAPIVLSFLPLGATASWLVDILRWAVAIVVIFAGIGLLYRFGPNRKGIRIGWLTPGAIMAGVSWAIMSIGFSYYVANFGNYNEIYGSIGAVIAMLVWLWLSSFLVLLGAALNAELELRQTATNSAADAPDQIGPVQPQPAE